MILRSTKKFFHKTLESVRSFLSGSNYQKLPKDGAAPTLSPFFGSYSHGDYAIAYSQANYHSELDEFYADFSNRWDSERTASKKRKGKKKPASGSFDSKKREKEVTTGDCHLMTGDGARRDPVHDAKVTVGERRNGLVEKMLELKMNDVSNVDHVLDIEEVLHCYSLLTCPTYREIVEKFFTEVYAELFGAAAHSSSRSSRQWTRGGLA